MKDIGNGLQFRQIKSSISKLNTIEILDFNSLKSLVKDHFGEKGICVFYLDYKVLIGKYDGEDFKFYEDKEFEPRFIQKMRLFNSDRELFIWRENKKGFKRIPVSPANHHYTIISPFRRQYESGV